MQISRETVYRYIRQGKLVASRLGRNYLIQKRNLDLLLWENRTGELPLRQYTRDKVESFLKEDELDTEAAHTVVTGSVVAATASIFKTDEPLKSAEELRVLAEEAVAADAMERAGDR